MNIEMGIKNPPCEGEVHWFTVFPSGEGSYSCECRLIKLQFSGFKFLNHFPVKSVDHPSIK